MSHAFVHLNLHSEFSLKDSLLRLKPLMKRLVEARMPAVALTDHMNLFAVVRFFQAAQANGIKPIVGAELLIQDDDDATLSHRASVLCVDRNGYLNLSRLLSRAYLEGQQRESPQVRKCWIEELSGGLILLSGGVGSDIGRALLGGQNDLALALAQRWQQFFPDRFYLELQRTGKPDEDRYIEAAVALAGAHRLPVVATNDVRFNAPDEFEAHEIRVCIQEGRTLDDPHRKRAYTDQQYLRTEQEMCELFADIPEALANTVEIAKRCNLALEFGTYYLPEFPVPEGETIDSFFRGESARGLEKRFRRLIPEGSDPDGSRRQIYLDRLQLELDVIAGMGFPGYFLIVADFIRWAKQEKIPVGPGRGSGAGSLVAYALEITDLDPIEYDLLFERFLNPERVSMPDFDVDFCMERRDEVIDYVARRYGRDRVSQIITFGTMAARAVVRDVGRVLSHPYGFVDQIAKLIPFEIGMTLDKALDESDELRQRYEDDEDVSILLDYCLSLEGLARNPGKHAGGVVIAPSVLTDFTPFYCDQGGANLVTQLDKDDVEKIGLVKFDFLGLRTLTIIDWAVQTINRERAASGEEPLDIIDIPLDDAASFDLLKACQTTAVFQLESRGMKDLIRRLRPDCFEDIVALVALFRPGPLQSGMVDNFIDRKHGREEVSYPDAKWQHESLKQILEPTYGIILYQEQVMQIAQVLAGYSLGAADLLRRAMGKKKPEEMAKQREVFKQGASARGVDGELAMKIFDLVEKFAGYGFNKSHSAAYALVAYQTAWLKAHHPAAFMAAVLSSDMDHTDKVVTFIEECNQMGIEVTPPDVNHSSYQFVTAGAARIVYGLGAIKGVGQGAIENIREERDKNGPFADLFAFCRRVDSRKLNRRVLESLIRAGALDSLGPNRATLFASLGKALHMAEQHAKNQQAGMDDLFGLHEPEESAESGDKAYELHQEWDEEQRLAGEKDTLGLYLTGHPINRYQDELKHFISNRIESLADMVDTPGRRGEKPVLVAGLVTTMRTMKRQRGMMAFFTLDDRSGQIEVAAFAECYEKYRDIIAKDRLLVVEGKLSQDDFNGGVKVTAVRISSIDQAREQYAKAIMIELNGQASSPDLDRRLGEILSPFQQGECKVSLRYHNERASAVMELGPAWRVSPTDELLKRLGKAFGDEGVTVKY